MSCCRFLLASLNIRSCISFCARSCRDSICVDSAPAVATSARSEDPGTAAGAFGAQRMPAAKHKTRHTAKMDFAGTITSFYIKTCFDYKSYHASSAQYEHASQL